jgi:hypothetical protein
VKEAKEKQRDKGDAHGCHFWSQEILNSVWQISAKFVV